MLVLSRKVGEKIIIADNIVITLIEIDRNKVRLGIEAPENVRVDRQEVHDKIAVPGSMRCPDCRLPGLDCDRCNGRGVVPLEMVQWIEQGKLLRAKRIHHTPSPRSIEQAASSLGIAVDEYVRQERGCVPPTL